MFDFFVLLAAVAIIVTLFTERGFDFIDRFYKDYFLKLSQLQTFLIGIIIPSIAYSAYITVVVCFMIIIFELTTKEKE